MITRVILSADQKNTYSTAAVDIFRSLGQTHSNGYILVSRKAIGHLLMLLLPRTVQLTVPWSVGNQFLQIFPRQSSRALHFTWLSTQSTYLICKLSRLLKMPFTINFRVFPTISRGAKFGTGTADEYTNHILRRSDLGAPYENGDCLITFVDLTRPIVITSLKSDYRN